MAVRAYTSKLQREAPFLVVFAGFVAAAAVIGLSNAFGPGHDYHYHVMSAAIAAHGWSGDAFYSRLYETVNPLDANTLFYALVFPLEKLLTPLNAMRVGLTLFYFVAYPAACAVGLRLMRRPMWGAILAFPLAYSKAWSGGGYVPFLSSAPLFVLAVVLLHRVLCPGRETGASGTRAPSRRTTIAAGVVCALLFLAHAHVYGWTMFLYGTITVLVLGRGLAAQALRDPVSALRTAARGGGRMLAVVAPSLLLFGAWSFRMNRSSHAAGEPPPTEVMFEMWQPRVGGALGYLVHTADDSDFVYVGALFVVCAAAFVLAERATDDDAPSLELGFLITLVSFLVLPVTVNGQGIAGRQIEMAMWLLPLVVYPRVARRAPIRHVGIVTAFVVFAALRVDYFSVRLTRLQRELAGLVELTRSCPPPHHELAYVTLKIPSKDWLAPTFDHAAETLAPSCRLDTPIYDPRIYPYNLPPIRYRGAPPAKPTILRGDRTWFSHEGLWSSYEYVLVHSWMPTNAELEAAGAFAERIRVAGPEQEWELWRRRRPPGVEAK